MEFNYLVRYLIQNKQLFNFIFSIFKYSKSNLARNIGICLFRNFGKIKSFNSLFISTKNRRHRLKENTQFGVVNAFLLCLRKQTF